jgi:hypothetical protein
MAIRFNYNPRNYYSYRLFDASRPAGEFIQMLEFAALQSRDIGSSDTRVLVDKLAFFHACTRAHLPTPMIVAALIPGRPEQWPAENAGELPKRGLFLKWLDSEMGVGAERWAFDEATGAWMRHGVRHDHDGMVAYCRARARSRGLLVQHFLENHPEVRVLSGDTLSTTRVMTYRDPGSPAALIAASFKVARPGADVDNVDAGGLACRLDPDTGALGVARGKLPSDGEHRVHPDTGVTITGVRLSATRDVMALALDAHEKLDVPWSVGWDVAMTPEGPMLIEGNPYWSVTAAQTPSGAPLPAHFATRLLARLTAAGGDSRR